MEVQRVLTSSFKRKPLSDCSNIAIVKPPKPSINQTPSLDSISCSHTSTGSSFSLDVSAFASRSLAPPTPVLSLDDRNHIPTVFNQRQDTKAKKDGIKAGQESTISESLSSGASDNCHHSQPPTLTSKHGNAHPMNNEEKVSEPITPHAPYLISAPARGIHHQRKSPRRRKHADGRAILPVSCPPGKRAKKKGHSNWVKHDDAGVEKQLGSLAGPLPLHEKRSVDQQHDAVHGLSHEEIDRLRSYYADVDAFELPEEFAPEVDSD